MTHLVATLDHLVVLAPTLDAGVRWCERTLAITPGPGGKHPLMGTENRLFSIASPAFPRAYLEILAIDPSAPPPPRARWFDLDDAALREAARGAPRLIAFVAATGDLDAARAALLAQGVDVGPAIRASRATPRGALEWRIAVRDDGHRLFDGALPTLIQWGPVHPGDAMAPSGVALSSLAVAHPRARELEAAFRAIGLTGVGVADGEPGLRAVLDTPHGEVALTSASR